jgi:3-oxoacyl-[acyl-carrier protein] reductase
MKLDFTNKTAIVTGADGGIGKAIAESLLKLNAKVIITGIEQAPEWSKHYSKCIFYQLDFLSKKSFEAFCQKINNESSIDILINNAGIQIKHAIDDIKDDDWDKVLAINLTGTMKMMRLVVPFMKKQNSGKIVNISSVAGIISKPTQSSYSTTKAGIIALTKSSALDLATYNIQVNSLCPGTTQTPMVENVLNDQQKEAILKNVPMKRFAKVSEIADFALFLCSKYNTFMTGQPVVVDGGFVIQ